MKETIRSKIDFSETDRHFARRMKALSHPARVAILRYLAKSKSCFCGDIVSKLPLAQSTISQHLRELREAGFIRGDIEGTNVCYCIDQKEIGEFLKDTQSLLRVLAPANTKGEKL